MDDREARIASMPAHQRPSPRELGRRSEAADHPFKAMKADEGGRPRGAPDVAFTAWQALPLVTAGRDGARAVIVAADATALSLGMTPGSQARNEKSKADLMEERYPQMDFENVLIGSRMLGAILLRGEMNASELVAALDSTADYAKPGEQPLWMRVANIYNSDDATSERIVADMEAGIAARKFTVRGEFFMIVGQRLWLSDIGLVTKDRATILEESKVYVDDLAGRDALETSLDRGGDPFDDLRDNVFGNNVIPEWGSDEMRAIVAHYDLRAQEQEMKRYPSIARGLIALLPQDPDAFLFELAPNARQDGRYWYHTILASLPPAEFARAVSDATPEIQTRAIQTLHNRHTSNPHGRLRPEREWIGQVRLELERLASSARPMTKCRIRSLVERNLAPLLPDEAGDKQ